MNKYIRKSLLPVLVIGLGLHTSVNAIDVEGGVTSLPEAACTLETLKGSYTWSEATRTDYSDFGFSEFDAGWVYAVSVGREVNDGNGNITSGHMTINNTFADDADIPVEFGGTGGDSILEIAYTGTVTVNPDCTGTYSITLSTGGDGGGGNIYIDPLTGNFKMLDIHNIGIANFSLDGSGAGLSSPFPNVTWP
ncbi:hypothetical protein [Leucothrix arctica]|uniref:Uncharacterized protein n=1 Tax=Leucothrix arctica TaxID=1481894 RepID=A0A317CL22_9GAMM|nr:hypothetical protein [Leucothrix arctica]PWQ99238.1 hypothetical protein DKT75_01445 [Leucothrix arctica]